MIRAKKVSDFYKKAVIFDFDDTLVRTDAKMHVYSNGRKIKSLTPQEFNYYVPSEGDELDYSDFTDPRIVLRGTKYKMWPALERLYFRIQNGEENADIYILTARSPSIKNSIWTYLKRNGIIIPDENIIAVGDEEGNTNTAERKKEVLSQLKPKYTSILFYDDSEDNIRLAGEIGGIDTILVDRLNNNKNEIGKRKSI